MGKLKLIESSLTGRSFRLKPHIIQDLNRVTLQRLEDDAGRWRDVGMSIGQSSHIPPPPIDLPRHVDDLCDYVNDNWKDKSALHLAAYVMWRLNWVHPFVDGNGRTTRAVSYLVLCSRIGFHIPGVTTIPELISRNKGPYYAALEAADNAERNGVVDVSAMEQLIGDHLAQQMQEALDRAEAPGPQVRRQPANDVAQPPLVWDRSTGSVIPADTFTKKAGAIFGGFTLLFVALLIILSIMERPVPQGARWLVVILVALCAGLSAGFFGGHANVRGTIPLGQQQHPMRPNAYGGSAVLIIVLVLGKVLFL